MSKPIIYGRSSKFATRGGMAPSRVKYPNALHSAETSRAVNTYLAKKGTAYLTKWDCPRACFASRREA